MNPRTAVPTNPAALSTWVTDFEALHGVPPIAGGETLAGAPPAAVTPPAPAPAPPSAQPAAPAPTPGVVDPAAAAQPGAAPAAPGSEGAAAAAAAPTPPDWAQTLIERMDEIAPPVIDPLAAELFGQPSPAAAPQAPPQGYTPDQLAAAQAAGLPLPQAPQATPGVPPQAGQPVVPPQGTAGDERAFVDQLIDQRAGQVAQRMIQERVDPYIAGQETQRRRAEAVALTQDYPEFRDPAYQSSISQRARGWAQQILGSPEAAGEPGFLELCHLAAKQLDAMQQEKPAVPGPGGEVPIEIPGGGNPGSAVPQPDQMAAGIVAASPGRGLNSLWT